MNYIGSKYKLLPFLNYVICETVGENNLKKFIFCDLFSGTATVGKFFKNKVKQLIANDWEYYSFIINKNYIENDFFTKQEIQHLTYYIDLLNNLPLIENGFIYKNYCKHDFCNRQYFSDYNGKKIDTIRSKIETLKNINEITLKEYYFLLCSLIESADKVANTASVYAAYLKHLKNSAKANLIIKNPFLENTFLDYLDIEKDKIYKVYCEDANILIKNIKGDILYLDPPYNHRQYGANYHLLNTIAEYKNFIPQGATGLPNDYKKSDFCSKQNALLALENLIKHADFKYIFLSYNDEGIIPMENIKYIMQKYGTYAVKFTNYKRFKADKNENRNYKNNNTIEYLHILQKY